MSAKPGSSSGDKPLLPNDTRYKDACQYAVGISEKFLILAAAGIAFVVGLVFAKENSPSVQFSLLVLEWSLGLFGVSILFGWMFLMKVVSRVAADNDYRIHNNAKQWLCLLQIVTALFSIGLLGFCAVQVIRQHALAKADTLQGQAIVTSSGSLKTAPALASHPLDPLTAAEFAILKMILGEQGQLTENTLYSWVQLREPPKAEVLAFEPGQKFRREAFVVALCPEKQTAYEFIVDLAAKKIVQTRDLQRLQPFLALSEFDTANKIIDGSSEIRAALEKRRFKIKGKISDDFYIDLYAAGEEPNLMRNGKTIRAMRVLFAQRQPGTNDYGPYVDGLMALFDLYQGKVIAVYDQPGAVAGQLVPHDVFDPKVLGPKVEPESKLQTGPSVVQNVSLEGNHLRWEEWDFRFSFNQREGLVLHQIGYGAPGGVRSICYRAAISEMFVPYSDPSMGWIWREFFDAGEYGLGLVSSEINRKKELPDNAITLDAVFPDEKLKLSDKFPNRVFLYERDGGALFAHTQTSDGSRIYARAKELVIGFIATVGNYDYLYKWVFRQDGTFGFEAELHGLILNRTIAETSCAVCSIQADKGPGTYTAEGDQRFGTLVFPQILGIYHQHWINLRMDFDVDGPVNAVKECNTKPIPFDANTNSRGRAFTVEHTIFGKEKEAERNIDASLNRGWLVYNPANKSQLGHPTGFEIDSAGNTVTSLRPERFGDATSFTQRHFWVTKYHPEEMYASGIYPNQAPPDYKDHLFEYANNDESIYKEDIVVWYSLGFTHVTRPEDYPIMPAGKVAVNFSPKGFFEKSPALGHANVEKGKSQE